MKFGRNYRLTVELEDGEAVVIEPPITVEFNVMRATNASINTGTFQIYNLSETRREGIFQDRFNTLNRKKIIFEAGYDKLVTIFQGDIYQADSSRNGSNIVTSIQARDGFGDIRNSQVSETFPAGISIKEILQNLIGGFENVTQGTISEFSETLPRPVAVDGNRFALINKYSGGLAYVDLNKVNVIKNEDAVEGVLPFFNAETGLLETPTREGASLTIKTLFEPSVVMSQLIGFESNIFKKYNGQYKVIGVQHQGTISEAVGGDCSSSFQLLLEGQLFSLYNVI